MNAQYAIGLFISAIISAIIMIVAWQRKSSPGAGGLALIMAALFIWAGTYAIHWIVNTPNAAFFWLNMTYFGVLLAPTAFLIFALQYTNRGDQLTRRNLTLMAIEPVITLILLWTDSYHGLFYAGQRSTGAILGGGIGFWFNAVYSYAIILIAFSILMVFFKKSPPLSQLGIWSVVIGMLLPTASTVIELTRFSPLPGLDLTPFLFTLSGIFIAFGLFHFQLLELTPVAYNKMIETMPDGMVVLDEKRRIVDMNPAVRRIFKISSYEAGLPVNKFFSPWPELIETIGSENENSLTIQVENGILQTYEVTVSKLIKRKSIINGWLLVFHNITAMKNTEEAYKSSENRLRSLFLSMTDLILILDKDGRYLEIAPTNPINSARDVSNLAGKSVFDIFPQDQATIIVNTIRQALETGKMVQVDYSLETNQQVLWFSGNASPLTEDSVTWVARNITERKTWEEEIRRSENKLRSLFTAMNDVIMVFDHEGRYLEIAPTSSSGLILPAEELLGKTVTEILPPEPAAIIMEAIQQSISTKTVCTAEYNLPDGEKEKWFVATASPLTENSAIFVAHDITDQKKSARALKEKDIQYQELINNLNGGIGIVDLDETFIYSNPAADNYFGVFPDSLIGHNIREFVNDKTMQFLKEQTKERIAGKSTRYELEVVRTDGSHRILQVSPRPQYDQDGICKGSFAVFWDITDQKLAEQAIKESETRFILAEQIAHIGTWEYDISSRKIWASKETFNIFGLESTSQFISIKNIFKLIVPEDQPKISSIIKIILSGQPTYTEEFRIVRKGEVEVRIIHGIAERITDSNGTTIKISGVAQDITKQKQTEKALEKRMLALTRPLEDGASITFDDLFNLADIQQMQETFALATGVASVITLPDGTPITKPSNSCRLCENVLNSNEKGRVNCIRSNDVFGEFHPNGPIVQPCISGGMWDAGADISVGGKHIANWIIGQVRDDDPRSEELMRLYAREIDINEDEVIKAYREVPVMSRKKFEQVAQALFTLTDQLSTAAYQNVQQARFISERKKAEDALLLSENKLRSLFKAMSDVIIIYSREGRYLEIAQTNSNRLYRSPDYLLNRTISDIFPSHITEFFLKTIEEALSTNAMVRVDYELPINGINYWFAANVSPLTDDSVIWVARDITERKKVEETLHYQNMHDSLTGLFNRQYYETEIVRLQRSRLFPISIMVLDVDDLKWVNDHHGHSAGDELLQRAAGILKSSFRPEDMVARMGGDEFVVVLPETDELAAEKIKVRFEEILLKHNTLFSPDMRLGISTGVATGGNEQLLTEVFKQADQSMYQNKGNKKSRFPI